MSPEPTETAEKRPISPLLFLALIAAINLAGPFLPIPNVFAAIASGVLMTIVYVGAVIGFGLGIARSKFSIPTALGLLVGVVAIWLAVEYGLWPVVRSGLRAAREVGQLPTTGQQLLFFGTTTLQDLAMVSGACLVGTVLAKMIKHANMLGPIGAAIALIDIWGVLFGGIVSQMLTNKATQPIAERAMAAGPKVGV
ncbi:hypothetical protein EON80_25915, partial [bacterium]